MPALVPSVTDFSCYCHFYSFQDVIREVERVLARAERLGRACTEAFGSPPETEAGSPAVEAQPTDHEQGCQQPKEGLPQDKEQRVQDMEISDEEIIAQLSHDQIREGSEPAEDIAQSPACEACVPTPRSEQLEQTIENEPPPNAPLYNARIEKDHGDLKEEEGAVPAAREPECDGAPAIVGGVREPESFIDLVDSEEDMEPIEVIDWVKVDLNRIGNQKGFAEREAADTSSLQKHSDLVRRSGLPPPGSSYGIVEGSRRGGREFDEPGIHGALCPEPKDLSNTLGISSTIRKTPGRPGLSQSALERSARQILHHMTQPARQAVEDSKVAWNHAAMKWREKNKPSPASVKKRILEESKRQQQKALKRTRDTPAGRAHAEDDATANKARNKASSAALAQPTEALVRPSADAHETEWRAYYRQVTQRRIELATSFVQVLRLLHVPCPSATKIKDAYRLAVRMYHPDSNSRERVWNTPQEKVQAEEVLKIINERKPDDF